MSKTLKALLVMIVLLLVFSCVVIAIKVNTREDANIHYEFDNNLAGYAEGTLTLDSDTDGQYGLYWADDSAQLSGYYPITTMFVQANSSESFEFGYHTAIPAGASRVIAKNSSSEVVAEFNIPARKRLDSSDLKYKFNSYSDIHIDKNGFYVNADKHWREALKYAVDTEADFIVTSGDTVTNAAGPDGEWDTYERIIAESDYVNPIWECNGNHDVRCGVESGLKSFIRASGADSTIEGYDAGKPYYYMTEKNTGDIFIFMALEKDVTLQKCDEFSDEQMEWVSNLISRYYGTGVNIYIVEHSPIEGFGAGDRMGKPYYKDYLSEKYINTVKFKSLLQKYPKLIWMSGHSHEDFSMGYNFSDENGTACSMIHNPAVAGSTWASETDTSLGYNEGRGYSSQGYTVEVYNNQVVYYGANLSNELIYPAYCYIMDGARGTSPDATQENVYQKGDVACVQLSKTGRISKLSANGKSAAKKATGAYLDEAKSCLDAYYSFASYDQYQNLKKLCRSNASAAELDTAIAGLKEIAEHIGKPYVIRKSCQ
ncbi:MAG: metallophosphoesterase [Ruminococcus sp.]|nr:metallophosphoesterase [Ruminococcus sp.]